MVYIGFLVVVSRNMIKRNSPFVYQYKPFRFIRRVLPVSILNM